MLDKDCILKIKEFFERIPDKKRPLVIIIAGLLIIGLLTLSEIPFKSDDKSPEETINRDEIINNYISRTEEKLASVISSIKGAGETKVMLTLDSSDENVYASDINSEKSEYVVIKTNSNEGGMLLKIIEPKIRGVAVVCDGGDNPKVKIDIINAVCASLGISSTKVSVVKMKDRGD